MLSMPIRRLSRRQLKKGRDRRNDRNRRDYEGRRRSRKRRLKSKRRLKKVVKRKDGGGFGANARVNPFQRRRFASQTKPMQECPPERREGSLSSERSFAALRRTKRERLFFEMG